MLKVVGHRGIWSGRWQEVVGVAEADWGHGGPCGEAGLLVGNSTS